MIQFWNVLTERKDYMDEVVHLYETAFPRVEKKPFDWIVTLAMEGKMEIQAITDEEEFVGLAILMRTDTTALLDYFAISKAKRCGGYGGKAVRAIQQHYRGKKLILEIEKEDPDAPNAVNRKRRKTFYLKNGLKETGLFVNIYHTDFEIITPDGKLTFEEYVSFLTTILGEEAITKMEPKMLRQKKKLHGRTLKSKNPGAKEDMGKKNHKK